MYVMISGAQYINKDPPNAFLTERFCDDLVVQHCDPPISLQGRDIPCRMIFLRYRIAASRGEVGAAIVAQAAL